jgi:HPt (histidine-containing phosphotransfer) domain-containing protein
MNDLIDIDWERLHQISEDDTEFELELLTMLAEDVKLHIDDLRQAVMNGEAEAIAHEAHYIKGASANVGVRRIAALSKEIEQLAREQSRSDTSTTLVEQIAVEVGNLEAYLRSKGVDS